MKRIQNLLNKNGISKNNINKIITSFVLLKAMQSNYNSLALGVKKLAYRFNVALYPDIDKQQNKENEWIKCQSKEELNFIAEFIKCASNYICALPCLSCTNPKVTEEQKAQVIELLTRSIEDRKGNPNDHQEYLRLNNPNYMCDYLTDNFNLIKVVEFGVVEVGYWNGETYLLGKEAIKKLTADILSIEYNKAEESKYRAEIDTDSFYHFLLNQNLTEKNRANSCFICCKNGIVKINEGLTFDPRDPFHNVELLPYTPDIVTTFQFLGNFTYNIDQIDQTTVARMSQYYDVCFNRDNDEEHYPEIKDRILGFFSTILYIGQRFKCFGLLYGDNDGGKTNFFDTGIKPILNTKDVSNVRIDRFHNPFAISQMAGKCLNKSDDSNFSFSPKDQNIQENNMKNLVGGNVNQTDKKNKDDVSFVNYARQVCLSNEYPNMSQTSTEAKLVFMPFLNKLNQPKYVCLYPQETQAEKDFIFMTLLENLLKILCNFKETGRYFKVSTYIDKLQREAKRTVPKKYMILQDWIKEENPISCYPIGQYLSSETVTYMTITYFFNRFQTYLVENSITETFSREAFKKYFLKQSGLHLDNAKDTKHYRDQTYEILIPNKYKESVIPDYKTYKKLIDQEKNVNLADRVKENNSFAVNQIETEEHIWIEGDLD